MTELSPKFKYEVAQEPGGEGIKLCFACGICTASCPIREIDEGYNPRGEGMKFQKVVKDFIEQITKLVPLSAQHHICQKANQ